MAAENKIRTKVEIFVCLAIVALGTPICVFLGTQSAKADYEKMNPKEMPSEIRQLGFDR